MGFLFTSTCGDDVKTRSSTVAGCRSPTVTRKKNPAAPKESEATLDINVDGAKAAQHPSENLKTEKHWKYIMDGANAVWFLRHAVKNLLEHVRAT